MHVDALVEYFRTGVRLPPPPPVFVRNEVKNEDCTPKKVGIMKGFYYVYVLVTGGLINSYIAHELYLCYCKFKLTHAYINLLHFERMKYRIREK